MRTINRGLFCRHSTEKITGTEEKIVVREIIQTVKQNKLHSGKAFKLHHNKEMTKQKICNPENFQGVFITCSSLSRRVHKYKATSEREGTPRFAVV